jgi:hypothetical protein
MSFEALKQYFRSRHDKTSYTEKEPSTFFFSQGWRVPKLQDTDTDKSFFCYTVQCAQERRLTFLPEDS